MKKDGVSLSLLRITINELDKIIGNNDKPSSLKEALSLCRTKWNKLLGKDNTLKKSLYKKRKVKKGLVGKVSLGWSDRSFYSGPQK